MKSSVIDTVVISGIKYLVESKKPVKGRIMQWYLYLRSGDNRYLTIQLGKDLYSGLELLKPQDE